MSLLCAEQVYQLQLASQTFDLHPLAFTIKSEKSRICHIPKLFLKAHFSKGIQCHFTLWSARFFPKGCALQTLTNFLPSYTKKVNCHLLVGKDIILCHFFHRDFKKSLHAKYRCPRSTRRCTGGKSHRSSWNLSGKLLSGL